MLVPVPSPLRLEMLLRMLLSPRLSRPETALTQAAPLLLISSSGRTLLESLTPVWLPLRSTLLFTAPTLPPPRILPVLPQPRLLPRPLLSSAPPPRPSRLSLTAPSSEGTPAWILFALPPPAPTSSPSWEEPLSWQPLRPPLSPTSVLLEITPTLTPIPPVARLLMPTSLPSKKYNYIVHCH